MSRWWLMVWGLCVWGALSGCGPDKHLGPRLRVSPPADEVRNTQTDMWMEQIKAQGKDGYWLVIRGYKEADHLIVTATSTPLSHAAVLDLGNEQVVESVAKGVIRTPLRKFVHNAHRVLLIKPRWWNEDAGAAAAAEAQSLVGSGYDYAGLVGLSSDSRFYCSELAFHVYRKHHSDRDHIPMVIEPGQMYLWGQVLWDSYTRD